MIHPFFVLAWVLALSTPLFGAGYQHDTGIYLDSDRQLLFGEHQDRRNLKIKNLRVENDIEITLEWPAGSGREIVGRLYDPFDSLVGRSEFVTANSVKVAIYKAPADVTYRLEVIARQGQFSPSDRLRIVIRSLLPDAISFPDGELKNEPVAPAWRESQISMTVATAERKLLALAPLVVDPSVPGLQFSLVSGPTWARVSDWGELSVAPGVYDVGAHVVRARVENGGKAADLTVGITVSPEITTSSTETFFASLLTNEPSAAMCAAAQRVVQAGLLPELQRAGVETVVLGDKCTTAHQYMVHVFAEASRPSEKTALRALASRFKGARAGSASLSFMRVARLELDRYLELTQREQPFYVTGYGGKEKFSSALLAIDSISSERKQARSPSEFLRLAEDFFPSKHLEVRAAMSRADGTRMSHAVSVYDADRKDWVESFVLTEGTPVYRR